MPDLNTYEQIEAELATVSGYDVDASVSYAKRYIVALRRKMQFPKRVVEFGNLTEFDHKMMQDEISAAQAWLRENDTSNNLPSVVHADFSTFGGYGSC